MRDGPSSDPALLGRELSGARSERKQSLKSVADAAGVSAAYLQKLERGFVSTPSPRILRSLAAHLGLPYRRLMELAGYEPAASIRTTSPLNRALANAKLSQSEERAVAAFVETLVAHRPQSRRQ